MSGTDGGLQQQCCYAPLPYKVASGDNAPIRAEEAGTSEDSVTATVTRTVEEYTSIWEHQGRLIYSPLQGR